MSKAKTKEEILEEYSKYKKADEEILDVFKQKRKNSNKTDWYLTVKCLKHNYNFNILCSNYKKGKGCLRCKGDKIKESKILSKKQVEQDFQNFLKQNEDLIKVYRDNNIWWATIKCKYHGIFEIRKGDHKRGQGCPECKKDKISKTLILSEEKVREDFLKNLKLNEELIEVYQKKNSKNWNEWYAILYCDKHGEFEIRKGDHKNGVGCPQCNASKGETRIREYLINNNIYFEEQYKFEDCKYYRPLPFDFCLLDKNICIEYQGIQHYKSIEYFGGEESFKKQQINDKIKREYCKNNNIKLLEIPYTEYNNIEKILKKELS